MKKTNILSFLIATVMLLVTIYGASAAITFVAPTSGAIVSGSYVFNVTDTLSNTVYCNFSTTANSQFLQIVNTTSDQGYFNKTFNTATLTEAATTTLTVNCTNSSGSSQQNTITISVNNNAPVCSYTDSMVRPNLEFSDQLGLVIVQKSTGTTTLTYSWVLKDPDGNAKITSTSAEPTTFQGTAWDALGEYTLDLNVTDAASHTTACTQNKYTVTGSSSGAANTIIKSRIISSSSKTGLVIGVFVILIVLICAAGIIVISMAKKKGKKRR